MKSVPLRSITSDEAAAYRRDGAVLLKQIIPLHWIESLRIGLDAMRDDPPALANLYEDPNGGTSMAVQVSASVSPRVRAFCLESPAAQIAATVHGCRRLRYCLDQVFYKDPGNIAPSAWHQDTPYLNVAGQDLVRVWVPCDPAPREVAIEVVRGSHLWNVEYRPNAGGVKEKKAGGTFSYEGEWDERLPKVPDINAHRDSFDILGWAAEPGDAIVFYGNILHGAQGRKNWPLPRRALGVLFAGEDVRFVKRPGITVPDAGTLAGIEFAEGEPLDRYPEVFPEVWRAHA